MQVFLDVCVLAYIIAAEPVVIQMEPLCSSTAITKGRSLLSRTSGSSSAGRVHLRLQRIRGAVPARTVGLLIWPACSSATHLTRNKRKGSVEGKGSSALPSSSPVCRGTHPALFDGRLLLGNRCGTAKHKSGLFGKA